MCAHRHAADQIAPGNGVTHDGNGNVTYFGPGSGYTLTYDVANRPATVYTTSAYTYDAANLRVYYRNSAGAETIYMYGVDQKKLATYTISLNSNKQLELTLQSENVYFAGKLISAENNAVAVDGLGSVRRNSQYNHTHAPYGAEYNATTNDSEKYATYTRDSLTGLDYAMNRYYYSAWGRFMSPDRSGSSIDLRNPQSWNRYSIRRQ